MGQSVRHPNLLLGHVETSVFKICIGKPAYPTIRLDPKSTRRVAPGVTGCRVLDQPIGSYGLS